MRRDTVVRRFEIQALGVDELLAIGATLEEAGRRLLPPGAGLVEVSAPNRVPMMQVRIIGPSDAVAQIRNLVRRSERVRVHRDWLDVLPLGAIASSSLAPLPSVRTRPGRADYPDRPSLLRIDPAARSREVVGTGAEVLVAIVDSGLDVAHPAFAGHVWSETIAGREVHGFHCEAGTLDYDVTDRDGHGTKLAGTILGIANAVKGLLFLPVKFYDATTQPLADNAARAINVALDNHVDVIDLSFDLGLGSNELRAAFQRVRGTDTLVVVAAGNTGSDNDRYPVAPALYADQCRDQIITVMATDWYDGRPTFSNFGDRTVDLAAPGVRITTTQAAPLREHDPFAMYTGTSAAAAIVAGAAALLKAQHPDWTARQIKTCLMRTTDTIPGLRCVAEGRLNLGEALLDAC